MLSKSLNIILSYILITINISILLFSIIIILAPICFLSGYKLKYQVLLSGIYFSILCVSTLMMFSILIDFVFGFYAKRSIKGCREYCKVDSYKVFEEIFEDIKCQFNHKKVKLFISSSSAINAYAVGSFGRMYIVLTRGLLEHYFQQVDKSKSKFLLAIKGVLGHEMSHLVNKDFLPGMLLAMNRNIIIGIMNKIKKIIHMIVKLFSFIPFVNKLVKFIASIYIFIIKIPLWFYDNLISKIHLFILKQISRSTEYRCDRQSSEACGGKVMAFSLSLLPGSNGYFTLFATHPKTEARIKKVENIEKTKNNIFVSPVNYFANFLAFLIILYSIYFCKSKINIDLIFPGYSYQESVFISKIKTRYIHFRKHILLKVK